MMLRWRLYLLSLRGGGGVVQLQSTARCHMNTKLLICRITLGLVTALAPASSFAAAAETNAPVTVVSTQSAAQKTWLSFGLDRVEWLQGQWLGNPVWQYVAALIYIILALY